MTDLVPLTALLSMDAETLQRRIEDQRFALAAYQRQADLINTILDHIDKGTIDSFCNERGQWIKDTMAKIDRMETVQKLTELRKLTDG